MRHGIFALTLKQANKSVAIIEKDKILGHVQTMVVMPKFY